MAGQSQPILGLGTRSHCVRYDAHPAAAELADDAVGTELRTGLEGHEERRFYLSARVRWGDAATKAA